MQKVTLQFNNTLNDIERIKLSPNYKEVNDALINTKTRLKEELSKKQSPFN